MSDFYQTGMVATFHRLGTTKLDKIEEELSWYAVERPLALVLPSLYSELEGGALKKIPSDLQANPQSHDCGCLFFVLISCPAPQSEV